MKVKFIHTLLLAAAFVTASGAFVSCKDYESDDVQELKNLNQQQYGQFEQRLKTLEDQVKGYADLEARVNALKDTLNRFADTSYVNNGIREVEKAYLNTLANSVTNVEIQGTYAPAFGSLDLPGDIHANILATYYGKFNKTVEFPQAVAGVNLEANTEKYSDADAFDGNLGKIYVTVNPTSVDATLLPGFALEDSKGDTVAVTLGKAAPYNDQLTWGYTRANGANVYEIPVTVTKDQAKALDIDFNSANLKAAVKKAIEDHSADKANLKALAKEVAKFVYDNANGQAPRLGLATKYYTNISELKFNSRFDANKSADIEVIKGETSPLKNVSELNILATAFQPVGFDVNIDGSAVKENIKKAEDKAIEEAEKAGKGTSVENYLDAFNQLFGQYGAKYGAKFLDVALKPALLIQNENGVHALRGAGTTVATGTYTLVPTTWTYELIAPAFKKYVAVLDANGKAVVNETVDGDVRAINNVTLNKGTYTVVYEALDYSGNVETKTYTLTVD